MSLTVSEKKKIAAIVAVAVIAYIFLAADLLIRADLKERVFVYAIGITCLAILASYTYLVLVSQRLRSRIFVSLYIRGIPYDRRTYIDEDGKFVHRYRGEYNGIAKFRSGLRKITIRNNDASASIDVNITNGLTIYADIKDQIITVSTKHDGPPGTKEEIEERERRYKRVNLFLFFYVNLVAVLIFLNILALAGFFD